MATQSLTKTNITGVVFTNSQATELETQICALKKILPNFDFNKEGKSEDEMFEVLLRTIEYIKYLHTALEQQA